MRAAAGEQFGDASLGGKRSENRRDDGASRPMPKPEERRRAAARPATPAKRCRRRPQDRDRFRLARALCPGDARQCMRAGELGQRASDRQAVVARRYAAAGRGRCRAGWRSPNLRGEVPGAVPADARRGGISATSAGCSTRHVVRSTTSVLRCRCRPSVTPLRVRRAARSMRRRSPGPVRAGGDRVTSAKPARRRAVGKQIAFVRDVGVIAPVLQRAAAAGAEMRTGTDCTPPPLAGGGWGEGLADQPPNADSPVCARPRISACTSCVPS